jgi:hypothetical protein
MLMTEHAPDKFHIVSYFAMRDRDSIWTKRTKNWSEYTFSVGGPKPVHKQLIADARALLIPEHCRHQRLRSGDGFLLAGGMAVAASSRIWLILLNDSRQPRIQNAHLPFCNDPMA